MDVTIFGIHLKINSVAFTLPFGDWQIRWYGIVIAAGFLLALVYAMRNYKRFDLDPDRMLDVVLVTTPVAILCARSYYIIFDDSSSFKDFFNFSQSNGGFSGLAIYGGVIGAVACGALMCYWRKVKLIDMLDLAAIGFLLAQGIGRWGNFFNQEAFGGPTGSAWFGMTSENVRYDFAVNGFNPNDLAHPCFLYESIWCIAGFFILNHFSKKRRFSGEIALMYGVWYGFGRGFIELLRTDSLMLGKIRVSSLLSFLLVIGCGILLYRKLKADRVRIADGNYNAQFEADEETENTDETAKTAEENGVTEENGGL